MNRDELGKKMFDFWSHQEGIKVGRKQALNEIAKVEWAKLNTRIFFFSFLGTSLALFLCTLLSYIDKLPALFNWL